MDLMTYAVKQAALHKLADPAPRTSESMAREAKERDLDISNDSETRDQAEGRVDTTPDISHFTERPKVEGAPNAFFHPIKAMEHPLDSIREHPIGALAAGYAYPRAGRAVLRGGQGLAKGLSGPFKGVTAPISNAVGGVKNFAQGFAGNAGKSVVTQTPEVAAQRLGYKSLNHMIGEAGSGPAAEELSVTTGGGRAATAAGRAGQIARGGLQLGGQGVIKGVSALENVVPGAARVSQAASGGMGLSNLLGASVGEAAGAAPLATGALVAGAGAGGYAIGRKINKAMGGADYGSAMDEMKGMGSAIAHPLDSMRDLGKGMFGSNTIEVDKSKLGPGKTPAQVAALRAALGTDKTPKPMAPKAPEPKSGGTGGAAVPTPAPGPRTGMGEVHKSEGKNEPAPIPDQRSGMGDVHKFEGKDEPAPLESEKLAPEPQAPKEDLGGPSFGTPSFGSGKQYGYNWGDAANKLKLDTKMPDLSGIGKGNDFGQSNLDKLKFDVPGYTPSEKPHQNLRQHEDASMGTIPYSLREMENKTIGGNELPGRESKHWWQHGHFWNKDKG